MRKSIDQQSPGTPAMQDVAAAIKRGALAYLKQQISMMIWFVIVLFIVLVVMNWAAPNMTPALAIGIGVAFLLGVAASYGAGFIGMMMAV